MPFDKIRLHWGTPPTQTRNWHLGLFSTPNIKGAGPSFHPQGLPVYDDNTLSNTLHISLRGALLWFLACLFAAYFAGAALYQRWLVYKHPYNRIGYKDLILPSRWPDLPRLRAEAILDLGLAKLKAKDYANAFPLLRLGLADQPAHIQARTALIRFYLAVRLRDQADKLILPAFDHGYPGPEFLSLAFSLYADAELYDDWLHAARRARPLLASAPAGSSGPTDAAWLEDQTLEALLAANRTEDALLALQNESPSLPDDLRRRWQLRLLIAAQRGDEALAAAHSWALEQPRSTEPLTWRARAARIAARPDLADEAFAALRTLKGASFPILLYVLGELHAAARHQEADTLLEDLLFRHGSDLSIYQPLVTVLIEAKADAQLERVMRELETLGQFPQPALVARFELAFRSQNWPRVIELADTLHASSRANLSPEQRAWLVSARLLADACLDSSTGTQLKLVENVTDHPGTLRYYKRILSALLDARRTATATAVLSLAEGPYFRSPSLHLLRERLVTLQKEENARLPLASSTPRSQTWPDFEAFELDFNALVHASNPDQALALLSAARRGRSDWIGAQASKLDALELPLAANTDDAPRLQYLARTTLARGSATADEIKKLAQYLLAKNNPSFAALLLAEIVRHDPANADSLALLATLNEKRAKDSDLDFPPPRAASPQPPPVPQSPDTDAAPGGRP